MDQIDFIGKFGYFKELTFDELYKRYGDAYFEFELTSNDKLTDGYYTTSHKFRIRLNHKSLWFENLMIDGDPSNYNKNHHLGYKKLEELGYELPTEPQW